MLPQTVLTYLNEAARQAGSKLPDQNSSLFLAGVLDSFSLVDFVTFLEGELDIKIDDADLRPENFDTIAKVESFIEKAGGVR